MGFLNRIFGAKEVPWVVGIIAAMLGWALTHIVDRLTSAPLISYELESLQDAGKDGANDISGAFIVRNLTRQTAFRNLHFLINAGRATKAGGHGEPVAGSFIFAGEAFMANVEVRSNPNSTDIPSQVLIYEVPEIQPHQTWKLIFSGLAETPGLSVRMGSPPPIAEPKVGSEKPPQHHTAGEAPSGMAANNGAIDAVQLIETSWQTWLVFHEIETLAVLTCFFTFLLLVSLIFLRPTSIKH